jgi:hypothetical protein
MAFPFFEFIGETMDEKRLRAKAELAKIGNKSNPGVLERFLDSGGAQAGLYGKGAWSRAGYVMGWHPKKENK